MTSSLVVIPDLSVRRGRFPSLARGDDRPFVFADAPGGTQVPRTVIDAMTGYLATRNANTDGAFVTSRETGDVIALARRAGADLLGCATDEVVFGQNMTTLAFSLARALRHVLSAGDEVVVTRLDHDANISPWLIAAEDAGATVRWVDLRPDDCTLDLGSLEQALGPRTRIVAFTMASNAAGTVTPAEDIVRLARRTDAIVVADAVHLAQHRLVDLAALGADVVFCSPYKVFGPHMGMMAGRRDLLATWRPDRVRPSATDPPDAWETGTLSHEALAGFAAAVEYLRDLGRAFGDDPAAAGRDAVAAAFRAIQAYEAGLSSRFLEGARAIDGVRLYGIADLARVGERTPTFALRVRDRSPRSVAETLGERGIFVWDGNYYALAVMERLGLQQSGGAVRVGFCHYHTAGEVDRVLEELRVLAAGG